MRYLPHNSDKQLSFTGMCEIIKKNPKAILEHFDFVWEAIAEYNDAPEKLLETFRIILYSFRDNSGDSWPQFYGSLPEVTKEKLTQIYNL